MGDEQTHGLGKPLFLMSHQSQLTLCRGAVMTKARQFDSEDFEIASHATFISYEKVSNSIQFKCPYCKRLGISTSPSFLTDIRCTGCNRRLFTYSAEDEIRFKKEDEKKRKGIIFTVTPFLASGLAAGISYLLLQSEDLVSPFGLGTGILLTIVGGLCFMRRFLRAIGAPRSP